MSTTSGAIIACTLPPGEQHARRNELLPGLAERAASVEKVPSGVRLLFSASSGVTVLDLARVVDAERRCCGFLSFAVEITAGIESLALTVTGPPEAQEIISELTEGTRSRGASGSE